jgi:hypothetical protein
MLRRMYDVPTHAPTGARIVRVALVSTVAVGIATLVAEVGIYAQLIAPRYRSMPLVPIYAWVAMYLPVLLACVFVTPKLAVARDAVTAACAAGAITQLEKWALAIAGLPSHAQTLAVTDPARFWSIHFARMTFGFLVLFGLLFLARARFVRGRDARR